MAHRTCEIARESAFTVTTKLVIIGVRIRQEYVLPEELRIEFAMWRIATRLFVKLYRDDAA